MGGQGGPPGVGWTSRVWTLEGRNQECLLAEGAALAMWPFGEWGAGGGGKTPQRCWFSKRGPWSHSCLTRAMLEMPICFPGDASGKEPTCQCRRHRFDPWVRKIPWRWAWQSTPVFLHGESPGQRSLAGYSPWGHKETQPKRLSTHSGPHSDLLTNRAGPSDLDF